MRAPFVARTRRASHLAVGFLVATCFFETGFGFRASTDFFGITVIEVFFCLGARLPAVPFEVVVFCLCRACVCSEALMSVSVNTTCHAFACCCWTSTSHCGGDDG